MTDKAHEKAMNYLRSEEMLSSNLKWNKKLEKAIDIALKVRTEEILDIIETDRDNGNLVGERYFSASLCLSKVIKKLEEMLK